MRTIIVLRPLKRAAARLPLMLFLASLWLGCTQCGRGPSPEEQAMEGARVAAQVYYDFLLRGDYQQFLAGRVGSDSLPDGYREQLLVAYKQFVAQQQAAHRGIASASATRSAIDSTFGVVQVFVMLSYGDSTQEEIVVPMVEQRGEWKMK